MRDREYCHQSVLLSEAMNGLNVSLLGIYVDATFGRGGHAMGILSQLGVSGQLLALDKDPEAVSFGAQLFGDDPRFNIFHGSFDNLRAFCDLRDKTGKIDGVLFDLGVSSPQLDDPGRGFSFNKEGPLDMRMNPEEGISAKAWLNEAPESEIRDVIKRYGEEKFSRRIARAIIENRLNNSIESTLQLATIVSNAVPRKERDRHPATRTFQAIRIFINNELSDLASGLEQAIDVLKVGGRLAVISFHSLEDRIVKRFIRDRAKGDQYPSKLPIKVSELKPTLKLIGKAIFPGDDEVSRNPRARSAVMRVAEKLR